MRLLILSDKESTEIFTNNLQDIDLIISCGDINSSFLQSIKNNFKKDLIYIYGNHDKKIKNKNLFCLDKTSYKFNKYQFIGFSGSHRYNNKQNQYSQFDMFLKILKKLPRLFFYKYIKKRIIILISHSPIKNIHDKKDKTHQGFYAFYIILKIIKPILWVHGHTHLKDRFQNKTTKYNSTTIANIYGYKIIEIYDEKIKIKNR